MKQKVKFSAFSTTITLLVIISLIAIAIYTFRGGAPHWCPYCIATLIIAILITASFYAPLSISVDNQYLTINFLFRKKHLPLSEIEKVMMCPPTMAEIRICGSGGCFGYWGWFREPSIGTYFAYYGKASDCFLVELKNKRKYLLGCEDSTKIVEFIRKENNMANLTHS